MTSTQIQTLTQPHLHCCECGQEMEAKYQTSIVPTRPGYFLVTCETETCPMNGFTLAEKNYPPKDLDSYLASGKKRLAKGTVRTA